MKPFEERYCPGITGYQAAGRQKNAEPSIQSGSQNQNGRARQHEL